MGDAVMPNCITCEPRTDMSSSSNPAECTTAHVGYAIVDGVPEPNICSSNYEFEFGNDALPESLDIRHCLEDAVVGAKTGVICQPKCKSPEYQTTRQLPQWRRYGSSFCDDSGQDGTRYENGQSAEQCKKFCESWEDCHFFGYITEKVASADSNTDSNADSNTACQFSLGKGKCDTPLYGVQAGVEASQEWTWYAYDGASVDGFEFICEQNGKWGAKPVTGQQLPDKTTAFDFFNRQCEDATTPTTTPSLRTSSSPEPRVHTTEDPNKQANQQANQRAMTIAITVAVVVVVGVVVTVAAVVLTRQPGNADVKPRKATSAAEFKETAENARKLSVAPEGDAPLA